MAGAFAAGLAQGFASEFVPEFRRHLQTRKAQRGVNQAAEALGAYYQDASLGEMFKTMGASALAGGADPSQVTTALFQQGLTIQKEKMRHQLTLASQNNSFSNQAGLKILGGNINSTLSAQGARQQLGLAQKYADNDFESDGRRLVTSLLQGQQRTDRALVEQETRKITDQTNQRGLDVRQQEDATLRGKANAKAKADGQAPAFTGSAIPGTAPTVQDYSDVSQYLR